MEDKVGKRPKPAGLVAAYHLDAALRRALGLFGAQTVWGSDWPHTSLPPERLPSYAGLMAPLQSVLDSGGMGDVLTRQPLALYHP